MYLSKKRRTLLHIFANTPPTAVLQAQVAIRRIVRLKGPWIPIADATWIYIST
jgi:hypothetical protein